MVKFRMHFDHDESCFYGYNIHNMIKLSDNEKKVDGILKER